MISVIIPNYNGEWLLKKYLKTNVSIFKRNKIKEIIVVDDASCDNSVAYLESTFPEVKLIRNSKNAGFAETCNKGVNAATCPVILLLNTDMVLENFDYRIIENSFKDPSVFAVTPIIYRQVTDGTLKGRDLRLNESITTGYFKGGWFSSENVIMCNPDFEASDNMPVLWACGGGSFIDKARFIELGGFDTLYSPFYVEDLDLSFNAWKKGWKCLFTDRIIFNHMHQATIANNFTKRMINKTHLRNQYLFIWKNIDDPYYILSHIVTVVLKILTLQWQDISAVFRGLIRIKTLIKSRKQRPDSMRTDREVLSFFKSYNNLLKS
ncbi:MAG: glycosyltransferase family 2 protein [bacterium]|nr:glycosyltransferase family 2 protein [bacterium]